MFLFQINFEKHNQTFLTFKHFWWRLILNRDSDEWNSIQTTKTINGELHRLSQLQYHWTPLFYSLNQQKRRCKQQKEACVLGKESNEH